MLNTSVLRFVPPALALWRRHRLEALLAVLGIVAGVGGLVTVVAIGQGARVELGRALGSLGTGTLIVRSLGAPGIGMDRAAALDRLLGANIRRRVPVMQHVAAAASPHREIPSTKVIATEREYADAYGLALAAGRFVTTHDSARRERVCVLGAGLSQELFPRGGALGASVRLGPHWYVVIGVLAPVSASEPAAALPDTDRLAIVPLAPVSRRAALDEVLLQFRDETDMTRAVAAVQRIVEYGGDQRRFEYVLPAELIRQKHRMQRTVAWLLLGVTGVLLAVGGISIANVMLMSVLRRRGEIGLRRAVGATRPAIVAQFICEGMLICGAGGIAGVAIGAAITEVVARAADWPVASLGAAALAGVAASLLVGLAAASYPAWAAARIDPMRALA